MFVVVTFEDAAVESRVYCLCELSRQLKPLGYPHCATNPRFLLYVVAWITGWKQAPLAGCPWATWRRGHIFIQDRTMWFPSNDIWQKADMTIPG